MNRTTITTSRVIASNSSVVVRTPRSWLPSSAPRGKSLDLNCWSSQQQQANRWLLVQFWNQQSLVH